MQIHQLRNATAVLSIGDRRVLVDPMLSEAGALPGFKLFGGGRRRNPLVSLPSSADSALADVTDVLITHEHPDHLDAAGLEWIRSRDLPVWAPPVDVANLRRKGLDVRALEDGALGLSVEVVRSAHARGLLGFLLGPVHGVYLAHPDEPSLLLTGDSVLTDSVLEAVERLAPDVIVAPAGAADFGIGGRILFSVDDLVLLARRFDGHLVLNHLEALDHCPTTRSELRARFASEGLLDRVSIPEDGEVVRVARSSVGAHAVPRYLQESAPRFQKWVTAPFAGT